MEQTWFITGSSRGLGRALARAALDTGDNVVATARQPAQLDDLVAEYGERVHAIGLDVTDAHAARSAITDARLHFDRLDVIVNNAGYANVSPIETTDDEDFRVQFETNFWGVYHVSKAAIPVLREQGGGLVIQISSVGGRVGGSPGIASYQAAKFAIDGFSRVLRAETAPFGVKVMVVEPSGFRVDVQTVQIPIPFQQKGQPLALEITAHEQSVLATIPTRLWRLLHVHRQRTTQAIIDNEHDHIGQSDRQLADASSVTDHRAFSGLLAW